MVFRIVVRFLLSSVDKENLIKLITKDKNADVLQSRYGLGLVRNRKVITTA